MLKSTIVQGVLNVSWYQSKASYRMLASGNRAANTCSTKSSGPERSIRLYAHSDLINHAVDDMLIQAFVLQDSKDTPSTPSSV